MKPKFFFIPLHQEVLPSVLNKFLSGPLKSPLDIFLSKYIYNDDDTLYSMNQEYIEQRTLENNIRWIQLHFTDILGRLRVIHIPVDQFLQHNLAEGINFDGSSVGLTDVEDSDMKAVPDDSTFLVLP
jgi:glutamine synthetase